MNPVIVWAIILILCGVVEAATVGLASIWFAVGALVALIVAATGGPLWLQIVLFFVVSFATLALARPLAKKYLAPQYQPTNADRIIGTEGVVAEDIDNLLGQGLVSVAGNVWTARSQNDRPISKGTTVRILRIEGVKVFVIPAERSASAE